jgi:hypothetical protein
MTTINATVPTTITITYKAFSNYTPTRPVTSATFDFLSHTDITDSALCETIFHETNVYDGYLWRNYIEPALPENRTHTALSVGDEITITNGDDSRTYACMDIGFMQLDVVGY